MAQQRALNALEPFLALAKSASSPRAAADLIVQATSSPQTYVFAELLQKPNIQALADSPEFAAHLRLLRIFAWGTHSDYKATSDLPALNASQNQKLLLLSLLPLCKSPDTLSYATLQTALSLSTARDLEDLVTAAVYAGLLQARLDPLNQTVRVTSIAPLRDLAPGSVPAIIETLEEWESRCVQTLAEIEGEIRQIRARAMLEGTRESREERAFEEAMVKAEGKRDPAATNQLLGMQGAQGAKQTVASRWGKLLGRRGGKRSAPEASTGGSGGVDDLMDIDEDGAKLGTRSTRRKGK